MNYAIIIISFLGSGFINKLKKVNWQNVEDKFINKHCETDLLKKLVSLFFKALFLTTMLFELIFKYAILGAITYLIYQNVGVNEAYFYLLITIIIKLSLLLSKK